MLDEDKKKILEGLTIEQAFVRCGELNLAYEVTARLLYKKTRYSYEELIERLKNAETQESLWYQEGVAEGNLKLQVDLEYLVSDPKAKDAYKNLSGERRRQAINKKLDELFFGS